ncbi:MAG: hypothetical protein R3E48_13840 [Burkholderiaceae bacterium]
MSYTQPADPSPRAPAADSILPSMVSELPLRVQAYRYLFFDWMFADASDGSALARAAAQRRNRERARLLPVYMRRWLAVAGLLFGLGSLGDSRGSALVAATGFTGFALAVTVALVALVAFVGLRGPGAR